MAKQDDWFNVDDDGFQEKLQENRDLLTLFTDKALVVFWRFLNWCKTKGSFLLPSFMFILVTIFNIEIRDIKKFIPIFKRSLNGFFSDLELMNELNWDTISDQYKAAVINKEVKLIEGFDLPRLSGPVKLWKSFKFWNGFTGTTQKSVFIVDSIFILFIFFCDAKSEKC
jgi:hypothetical protein